MTNFKRRYNSGVEDILDIGRLSSAGNLSNEEIIFLQKVREAWNFYEGYHWENIDNLDEAQVTFNYCRPFVNKFVSFELGKGFSIKTPTELEKVGVMSETKTEIVVDTDNDKLISQEEASQDIQLVKVRKTISDYLNEVWADNKRDTLLTELGQVKSITGEVWVKVSYEPYDETRDIFGEYPNGRVRLVVVPTQYTFPKFNDHDKDKLESLLIMYPISAKEDTGMLFKRTVEKTVVYKEMWTNSDIVIYHDNTEIDRMVNPYGFIPFVQIKNYPIAGRSRGLSDIEDVIPLNVELNSKKSDVSEIIDYHSAPITIVYGARIGNLEKGANKVWGGLPKDARVENLGLSGDLVASNSYAESLISAMCEIASIPQAVMGGITGGISNTSGVALQYVHAPLIEKVRVKKACTKTGLERVNKMIIYLGLRHGLLEKPDEISMRDFVYNEVEIPDTLPKDELIELQKIQQELALGLECRHGAMERLGKKDIDKKIQEIDTERILHPEIFNTDLQGTWYSNMMGATNAGGMMNGENSQEILRKETTGENVETENF